jgi:hypothetical protein
VITVTVPWNAFYADEEMTLTFPDEWEVLNVPMHDGPDISDGAI